MSFRTARVRKRTGTESGRVPQEFYGMDLFASLERKRILIQDLKYIIELQRFFGHNIYKRKDPPPSKDKTKTNIDIDFFAPYFTRDTKKVIGKNGIYCYAPVLLFFAIRAAIRKSFLQNGEKLWKKCSAVPSL